MTQIAALAFDEAEDLAFRACRGAGADEASARSLARATIASHRNGRPEVGFAHLADYLSAFRAGRINANPRPVLTKPFPAFLAGDADGGIAQLGFDQALQQLAETAEQLGIALFAQANSFTTGELGYYVRRLAERELGALAFTNANAFMAPAPGLPRMFSTNPFAFAFPLGEGKRPILVDQSSSATAFVNVVAAATRGELLEDGVAIDAEGRPTRNPQEAMLGALLPFGGRKGANVALMVELMAAGLAGGDWSRDMADFQSGDRPLNASLTIIAFRLGNRPLETRERAEEFKTWLVANGTHVPGQRRPVSSEDGCVLLPADLLAHIEAEAARS